LADSMMKKTAILLLSLGIIFLFTSCIGIEGEINVNADGSGSLSMSYRISKLIAHLGQLEENGQFTPLPVNQEDFARTIESSRGIELTGFQESENEQDVLITADLSFESINSLNSFFMYGENNAVMLEERDSGTVFTYYLYSGRETVPEQRQLDILSTIFKDYSINLKINAPAEIKSVNRGDISGDGRVASLTLSMPDIISSENEIFWQVIW